MEKETLALHIDADGIRAYYNDDKMACDEQKRLLELLLARINSSQPNLKTLLNV